MFSKRAFIALIFSVSISSQAYWEAPVAGTVAGFQLGGPKGAALGLLVGCADEAFVYSGLFEKRYLTSGALGAGLLKPMKLPYQINEGIGFLAGLLLATGHLTPWLDILSGPAINALLGTSLAGQTGAMGGVVCSGVDSFLMRQNYTAKSYAGMMLQGISGANAIGSQLGISPYYTYTGGVGLAAILAMTDKPLVQTSALDLGKQLYALYAKLMDSKDLDQLIEKQMLAMISTNLALNMITVRLNGYDGQLENGVANAAQDPKPFYKALKDFSLFLPPYIAVNFLSNQISEYLSFAFSNKIEDQVFGQYLSEEAPLRLGLNNATQTAVSKLRENIQKATKGGNHLLGGALQTGTNALYQLGILYQTGTLDLLIFSSTYQSLSALVSVPLSRWHSEYQPLIDNENNKVKLYDVAVNTQSDLIVPYDRLDFLKDKLAKALESGRGLQYRQASVASLMNIYNMLSRTIEWVSRFVLISKSIIDHVLQSEQRYTVFIAGQRVSAGFAWASENSVAISEAGQQIKSVTELLDAIESSSDFGKPQLIFTTEQGPELMIEMRNIQAGLDEGDTKLVIDELVMKKGIYAVTAPSGYGKSTFLKKLKGLKYSYGWATGNIKYQTLDGKFPKLTFISQKDYLMPYSSLIEIILSKIEYSDSEFARVQQLIQEIGLNKSDLLTQKANWEELSGGERKKVSVISAIMQSPDILVLDETFTGLDPKSLEHTQNMLKKYLPNTMFLVVEQQLESNNRFGFYQYELRLNEGKIRELN